MWKLVLKVTLMNFNIQYSVLFIDFHISKQLREKHYTNNIDFENVVNKYYVISFDNIILHFSNHA